MARRFDVYKEKMRKLADIHHAVAVLSWDKEVNMPVNGYRFRAQQIATLAGMAHEEFTSTEMGELLRKLEGMKSLSAFERRNVELSLKDYRLARKFSRVFVEQKSMAVSRAFQAWEAARKANDFSVYAGPLDELIQWVRKEAKILDAGGHVYDGLLDRYEEGMTVAQLDEIFDRVQEELIPLAQVLRNRKRVKSSFLHKKYPAEEQWSFGLYLLENMGYAFDAGRQDKSIHPFTISFSPEDVRVTTRVDERDLSNMTWSCIHEGGHALYEQGLNSDWYGLPVGSAISLGIHESQSRLWENNVGRSKAFWKHHFPVLKKRFPSQLKKVGLNEFYAAINSVQPNLIRTEADEIHYHIHVLIRYKLEKMIIEGGVSTSELGKIWNELYREHMGISAQDDVSGILQDIHWAHGSFGYFPTYSLGSFYAAQFYAQAEKDIKKLKKKLSKGRTDVLLNWLREHIHSKGRLYTAEQLCTQITGEGLNMDYFLQYIQQKYKLPHMA